MTTFRAARPVQSIPLGSVLDVLVRCRPTGQSSDADRAAWHRAKAAVLTDLIHRLAPEDRSGPTVKEIVRAASRSARTADRLETAMALGRLDDLATDDEGKTP